jgi:lipopolysaccharide biosynthesis glycosyltransferase
MNNCIAYIVNSKYLPLFKLSILSLFNSNPDLDTDINIFISDNIDGEIRKITKNYKHRVIISQINLEKYKNYSFFSKRDWKLSPATRLEIFNLKKYSRVLYLDCDTIILKSISSLFTLSNKHVYACRLHDITNNSYFGSQFKGFNAGVMLFGKKFLTSTYFHEVSKLIRDSKFSGNQEAFNLVYKDCVVFLDQKYNLTLDLATLKNMKNAVIFHYIGEKFYTEKDGIIYINDFSDYVKRTTHPLVLNRFKTIVNDTSLKLNKT